MKTLLVAASVLALVAAAPAALAQEEHHAGGNAAPRAAPGPAEHAAPRGPAMNARPAEAARPAQNFRSSEGPARAQVARPSEAPRSAGGGRERSASRPQQAVAGRQSNAGPSTARRAGSAAPSAARHAGSAAAARSPAVAALRRNVQATRRFQAGAYRPPAGYSPRHWSYGQRLPGAYFGRNYWLTSYWLYGLFGPPSGLVWVRVGYDALLIDEYTGEIIQVDYGVFY